MAEMGHTDPALALRIYAQAMRRDASELKRLQALVAGTYDSDEDGSAASVPLRVGLPAS